MDLRISQVRDCPVCLEWLAKHPTLARSGLGQERYKYPRGPWKHTTPLGMRIHRLATSAENQPARG